MRGIDNTVEEGMSGKVQYGFACLRVRVKPHSPGKLRRKLTCFSSRISRLYSVQQTRLRSEQTLKRLAASGWKQAKTPFSRIDIRRSSLIISCQHSKSLMDASVELTLENDPYNPFLLSGCTLLIDLS